MVCQEVGKVLAGASYDVPNGSQNVAMVSQMTALVLISC